MKLISYIASLVLALILVSGCQTTARKPAVTDEDREMTGSPEDRTAAPVYTDALYIELVKKYTVDEGERVDYQAWKNAPGDIAALNRQVELIAKVSPASHPGQFPTKTSERSYWINAYNTLVLQAVLEYWPLESVRDVKLSFSSRIVPGKGFFYDRKVIVGGDETNLYKLEREVLRSQKDPRLHFALNCASESCPVLKPWEWTEEQLDAAAREFINTPENVLVAEDTLQLSRIFKWYKKDFPEDIYGYLREYAAPGLNQELQEAADRDYRIRYSAYDWSLNAEKASAQETGGGQ